MVSALPAGAAGWDWTLGERALKVEWLNTVSVGSQWRVESRDPALVGKSNLEQNRGLCAPDDCIGLSPGETEPNARYLAAPGAMASYTDDGNLNYDRGDIVAAAAKWSTRFSLDWDGVGFEFSGLYFFDPVNEGFRENKPNLILEPGPQPGVAARVARGPEAERDIGEAFQLRNLNVWARVPTWGEQEAEIRVGRQLLIWGVSTFGIATNLNIVNPADLNALVRPGGELYELFQPQNMVTVKAGLGDSLNLELWYQLEWRPYGFPAKGSYFSFLDAGNEVEENETLALPFAKTPDDPLLIGTPASPLAALVSATSFSARRAPNNEPPDDGQYGFALHWFAEDLGSGTEISFHFANYHARLPNASAYAAQASCTRREGNANGRDTANLLQFLSDCGVPLIDRPGEDFEALPIDTARYFLDYPRDIRLFGLGVTGEAFGAALQGELVYRPNVPVQVDLEDVLFAAFQPAFPRETITIIPETLPGVPAASLAGSRVAVPDFLTAYRGGTPGEVAPGELIRGYERQKMWQGSLGFLRVWGPDFFPGADQFGWLFEFDAIWLPELPGLDRIQFEGPGTFTHASPGVADTGNGLLINPIQNRGGYVTELSYGYRMGLLALYNNVGIDGLSLRPLVVLVHDLEGVAPGFAENFLEDRKIVLNNLEAKYGALSLNLQYAVFAGAGSRNPLRDRDAFGVALSYDF
jgi:hypothetical protein